MSFYNLIQGLVGKGPKIQEEVLRANSGPTTKELFRLMLDPSIVYNIKAVPFVNPAMVPSIDIEACLLTELYRLIRDDLRGGELTRRVQYIAGDSTRDLIEVLSWILDRQNPAKIGVSLVNKVWPGLIYTQVYMGAVPGTEEALERLDWARGINVQTKVDGMTMLVQYKDGKPADIRTRQGQSIGKYFPEFLKSCPECLGFSGLVHHEGIVWSAEGHPLDRQTGNGLINQQVKNGVIGGPVDNCLHTVILDKYIGQYDQCVRYTGLKLFVSDRSTVVHQHIVFSLAEAKAIARKYIRAGGEGVVCKDPYKPFKDGKPWYNVKIKNEFDCDLVIIDTKPHSKKPDELGAVLCASSDRKLLVWVNLRTDADRKLTDMAVMGEIVQVKAESVIDSKSKTTLSLYLPRMDGKEWSEYHRPDKTKADYLTDIKDAYRASRGN